MSPEDEINKIKLKCAVHDANYDVMCRDIKDIKSDIKDIKEMLENKYAAKWVEKAVTGLIVLLVLAALYQILNSAGLPH